MKFKRTLKLLALLLLLCFPAIKTTAQVTIGSNQAPLSVSLLELIVPQGNYGGLRLPLLTTDQIEILAQQIRTMDSESIELAKGMMVFNTITNCTMVWNGTEFKSLCGDVGQAELLIDCNSLKIYPDASGETDYQQGTTLYGSSHYIEVPVECTSPGTYSLAITTGNGYSFISTGTTLEVGNYVLTLYAQGTPVNGADDPQYYDNLTIKLNNEIVTNGSCNSRDLPTIPVKAAIGKANYTIDCGSAVVSGTYIPNSAVTSGHYITIDVDVTTAGFYSFSGSVAGVTFSRTGIWAANAVGTTQQIVLRAGGTPTATGSYTLTITGETSGDNVTCDIPLQVVYRSMKIMGLGGGIYQPGTASSTTGTSRTFIEDTRNFGPDANSVVKTQGLTIYNAGAPSSATLNTNLSTEKPDIIVIGYDYNPDATACGYLKTFIDGGGVVISFCQNDAFSRIINAVFRTSVSQSGNSSSYLSTLVTTDLVPENDPILFGPFSTAIGGLAGKMWGGDVLDSKWLTSTPDGAIVYSYEASRPTMPMMLRHPTLGFITASDGGFLAGDYTNVSTTTYPFKLDSNNKPASKGYYGSSTVYNSYIFGNIMAWAIEYVFLNKTTSQ